MCWNCLVENGKPCISKRLSRKEICLREEQDNNGHIKLDSSHQVCPQCPNFYDCSDLTVLNLVEKEEKGTLYC
jgi:hypothetical protein